MTHPARSDRAVLAGRLVVPQRGTLQGEHQGGKLDRASECVRAAVARRERQAGRFVVGEEGVRQGARAFVGGGENDGPREVGEHGGRKGGVGELQVCYFVRVSPGLRSRRSEVRILLGS
jgi:hypothetical protein